MEFYIDNRQETFEVDDELNKLIESVIIKSLNVEGLSTEVEVSISFVDNVEIKELNKMYRNIDKATDVLSFPMDEDILVPMPLLGDIIISIETAREQANELGHSLNREICYLIAHSMFHLMGYDHMEEEEKKEMRLKEKQVMKDIGVFKAREEE
jgi:probable rRNA maturation factor